MRKLGDDKLREVKADHNRTWVAHPTLVKVAKDIFDKHMLMDNQIRSNPAGASGASVTEADLLRLPNIPKSQAFTSKGLVHGIGTVLAYTEA